MFKKASLKKVAHARYEWRVRWSEGGRDCQKYFAHGKKAEAKAFLQAKSIELANHGTRHGTITDAERAAIITFREAVAALPEPRPVLMDCVNAFLSSIQNQLVPITVADLVQARIAAAERKGVHARTLRDLGGTDGTKGRLGAFAGAFGERQAAGISTAEIEHWLDRKCATDANRREMIVRLNGLFAFGLRKGFLRSNPVVPIVIPRPNPPRASILTVKQAAALLANCPPCIVPAVAVQLFAGLRFAETERLDWQQINFEQSSIKVTQRKGAGLRREKARIVPLLPTLQSWLVAHRQPAGALLPVSRKAGSFGLPSRQIYRKCFAQARSAAGIAEWDENTLRHTYGSYRLASIHDLERVRVEMGHTTSRITSEHYVNAVTEAEAGAFWRLGPGDVGPLTSIAALPGVRSA